MFAFGLPADLGTLMILVLAFTFIVMSQGGKTSREGFRYLEHLPVNKYNFLEVPGERGQERPEPSQSKVDRQGQGKCGDISTTPVTPQAAIQLPTPRFPLN